MSKLMHSFRKHQKVMLAVVGVLIIIAFVVLPPIADWLQQSRSDSFQGDTVVTYKGGKINEQTMHQMVIAHYRTVQGCMAIAQAAQERGARPYGFYIDRNVDEQTVLNIKLLAEKAKQLGMTVDDQAVRECLYGLYGASAGEGKQHDGDIRSILRNNLPNEMSDVQFFEQMKIEMLAFYMQILGGTTLRSTPPSEAYAFFERLNREAQIESLPVKVEDYVKQVDGKPSEKELRDLYDKYKDQIASPDYPEPGFKEPPKVAIQYVKADFNKFVEEAQKGITDEQIQKEYDAGVAAGNFTEPELPPVDDKKPEDKKPAGTTEDPKPDDAKPDDKKPDDAKPEDKKPDDAQPEEKKSDDAQPEEKKSDDAKPEDKQPAGVEGDKSKPEDAKPEGECVQDAKPDDEKPVDEKKPEDKATDETKPEEKPADEKKPAEEKPAEEKPADTDPEKKPEDAPAVEKPATEKPKPKIQPLEKVRDQILRQLALRPAQQKIDAAFKNVENAVRKHHREVTSTQLEEETSKKNDKKDQAKKKALPEFDVATVAKENGLDYDIVPLTGPHAMYEYEIGKTFGKQTSEPFLRLVYSPNAQLYVPTRTTTYFTNTEYLSWVTEKKEEFTPTYEEAKPKVEEAWKFAEARKLAEAAAQELTEKVTSGKSLKEVFADSKQKVTESGKFTWMRGPNLAQGFGGQATISEVLGVEQPDNEFMKTVFGLKVGETGVAPNRPKSTYYVVRVIASSPGDEVLREQFGSNPLGRYMGLNLARQNRQDVTQQWYEDLNKEFNVQWVRTARSNGDEL